VEQAVDFIRDFTWHSYAFFGLMFASIAAAFHPFGLGEVQRRRLLVVAGFTALLCSVGLWLALDRYLDDQLGRVTCTIPGQFLAALNRIRIFAAGIGAVAVGVPTLAWFGLPTGSASAPSDRWGEAKRVRRRRVAVAATIGLRVAGSAVATCLVLSVVALLPTSDDSAEDLIVGLGLAGLLVLAGPMPWVLMELLMLWVGEQLSTRWRMLPYALATTVGCGVSMLLFARDASDAHAVTGYYLLWGWAVVAGFALFGHPSPHEAEVTTRLPMRRLMW
jgi:hypothetical protein